VDKNGSLQELAPATRAIYAEHPEMVFPQSFSGNVANDGY
jgi:hypothetical protein